MNFYFIYLLFNLPVTPVGEEGWFIHIFQFYILCKISFFHLQSFFDSTGAVFTYSLMQMTRLKQL